MLQDRGSCSLLFLQDCLLRQASLLALRFNCRPLTLGDTNFEDAFGEPGWFLEEFPVSYIANELKDAKGKPVPGSNRVKVYSTTSHIAFINHKRFLGGGVAAEVLVPLVDVDMQLANGSDSEVRGFGDLLVGSGIQWAPIKIRSGVLAQRVIADIGVPTGKYSDARAVNIGNHFVVVNPYYAVTYEDKKVEFSTRLHYLWNSTNSDPFVGQGIRNMQPGQAFHANYAASVEVFKDVRFGLNGYWLQQLTDHVIDGISVANSKERTIGLGPGIQLGGPATWFRLNSYLETDVRNRPSGIMVTFRISKALAMGKSKP